MSKPSMPTTTTIKIPFDVIEAMLDAVNEERWRYDATTHEMLGVAVALHLNRGQSLFEPEVHPSPETAKARTGYHFDLPRIMRQLIS